MSARKQAARPLRTERRNVYFFGAGRADGKASLKELLGGKGANLAEMTRLGVPVPPGFTISTEVCAAYQKNGGRLPEAVKRDALAALAKVEKVMQSGFGDAEAPLLVSVRSGARASMPGMLDTVLNLGLNDATVKGLAARADERFAYDSYRRFVQMYADVVLEIPHERFESRIEAAKRARGIQLDIELRAADWQRILGEFFEIVEEHGGRPFPQDPEEQLWGAVAAVFRSWENDRARRYRKIHGIPDSWGTAVNVQAMVFGNMGDGCATGVAFTRDPSTGDKHFYGEYLKNAQGEDVVAGTRTPQPINRQSRRAEGARLPTLEEEMPRAYRELVRIYQKLERHYREMQDIEFTIENGKLWMLQTRTGKRTTQAAVKIAVDMAKEGLISREDAILRIDPHALDQLLHPTLDPKAERVVIAKGLPASPGAASGRIVFSSDEAEARAKGGEKLILVRIETSPDDIHGMHAAQGILTARGGMTCVAGETRILTDRGMMTAEHAFKHLADGGTLRILSVDSGTMRGVWRDIIAAGKRDAEAITVSVSQTGRVDDSVLRITEDHKMLVLHERALAKKPVRDVLADDDLVLAVDQVPAFGQTATSAALAYVAGAILSDGYVRLTPTKGSVTFIQKPTEEKADFIAAVERAFLEAFSIPFSYVRRRESTAVLGGREIQGSVEDRICFRRAPAERLAWIRGNLVSWVLSLDATAVRCFLAGYVDGDGTYAAESRSSRIQISVAAAKSEMLDGVALACLRLGIVPQVTNNRDNWTVQIVDKVEEILAFTQRVHAEISPRIYESRCLSVRGLFDDIGEQVNFMGRVKEGVRRNIMFGAEKIRRDIAPLCSGEAARQLHAVLGSSLRSHRIKKVADAEPTVVYNFEVDARDELDKNFVVFTSRLTPVLVSNSHAAVVARGMGKCCVAGCGELRIDYAAGEVRVRGELLRAGDVITLDGSTGEVMRGEVQTVTPELGGAFKELMRWADRLRRLSVRTNADTPADALVAREFGAEGIGLCRTEHMFFEPNRILAVREMILAPDVAARERALAKLLPMQRGDFAAIFRAMAGQPVTIRLLDPPLHEFLPKYRDVIEDYTRLDALGINPQKHHELGELKARLEVLIEANPMLGHRGCRLGITFPEIYDMQVRAIMEAACGVKARGIKVEPEIMIPLTGTIGEMRLTRGMTVAVAEQVIAETGVKVPYLVGTMIEVPRASLVAGQIAECAEFFSFGTNDMTQMTFGYSRDDIGKFLPYYLEKKLLPADPFAVLDQEGVGELVRIGIERGRRTRPALKVGICGEHGGEPSSVEFCHRVGMTYVSCSPFMVPIARLAAAQAQIKAPRPTSGGKRHA